MEILYDPSCLCAAARQEIAISSCHALLRDRVYPGTVSPTPLDIRCSIYPVSNDERIELIFVNENGTKGILRILSLRTPSAASVQFQFFHHYPRGGRIMAVNYDFERPPPFFTRLRDFYLENIINRDYSSLV